MEKEKGTFKTQCCWTMCTDNHFVMDMNTRLSFYHVESMVSEKYSSFSIKEITHGLASYEIFGDFCKIFLVRITILIIDLIWNHFMSKTSVHGT